MLGSKFVLSFGDLACPMCMREYLLLSALCARDSIDWWNVTPVAPAEWDSAASLPPPAGCRLVGDPALEIVSTFGASLSPTVYLVSADGTIFSMLEGYVSDKRLRSAWEAFMRD
jgi:hypothetical protein